MNRLTDNQHLPEVYYQYSEINISPSAFWTCAAGAVLILAYLFHASWVALDYPILPISQILWNCFVWLMPSSIILGLRPSPSPLERSATIQGSSEHAAKSEVLRKVFKLDKINKLSLGNGMPDSPPGLGNWDNSCYQNSVLQALASVHCLRMFLENLRRNITDLPDDSAIAALENLVESLNSASNAGKLLWTPHRLKSMNSWQQQDAQEYFSRLVEDMEKETVSGWNRCRAVLNQDQNATLTAVAEPSKSEDTDTKAAENNETLAKDTNFEQRTIQQLRNPVEGLLAQRVGCTRCGFTEGLSLIPFNCLTLPLGSDSSYELSQCLDEYTTLEYIEGVECPKCSLLQMSAELKRQAKSLEVLRETDNAPNPDELDQYKERINERLEAIAEALDSEDFSESTLGDKCHVPRNKRTSSTKSKQVMVMKAPQCVVLHVNRSVFDEYTGAQLKNYANLQYNNLLDLKRWCVGRQGKENSNDPNVLPEQWQMNPNEPMQDALNPSISDSRCVYELRAVVTHLGRHENGHYVCYRKLPFSDGGSETDKIRQRREAWWRISDEKVFCVDDDEALAQGGVFMLFYERTNDDYGSLNDAILATEKHLAPVADHTQNENSEVKIESDNESLSLPLDETTKTEDQRVSTSSTDFYAHDISSKAPSKNDDTLQEDTQPVDESVIYSQSSVKPPQHQVTLNGPRSQLSPIEIRTSRLQNQHSKDPEHDPFLASRPVVPPT